MSFEYFFAVVYILLGAFFSLTGFQILKPFKNDEERQKGVTDKYKNLYRYGGMAMVLWGLFKLFR